MTRRRAARPPRGRGGRPWQKTGTRGVIKTGWTTNLGGGLPWVPKQASLDGYRRCVRQTGDAAALVEAVRHCYQYGDPVPAWVVTALERWLSEFVPGAMPPTGTRPAAPGRFQRWARAYRRACRDRLVADHLETNRRAYGLTWDEALDEASCALRGTAVAGTPEALKKARSRALRRAKQGWFQRLPTNWEQPVMDRMEPPVFGNSPRTYWRTVNADRQGDRRGEWRQRPRRLAHLSLAKLAAEVHARQRRKWGPKRR